MIITGISICNVFKFNRHFVADVWTGAMQIYARHVSMGARLLIADNFVRCVPYYHAHGIHVHVCEASCKSAQINSQLTACMAQIGALEGREPVVVSALVQRDEDVRAVVAEGERHLGRFHLLPGHLHL